MCDVISYVTPTMNSLITKFSQVLLFDYLNSLF
jgi:hypothetical protein